MGTRQFRDDDTSKWIYKYGSAALGDLVLSTGASWSPANAGLTPDTYDEGETQVGIDSVSSFVDGDLVLIHQSQDATDYYGYDFNWELNRIESGAGTNILNLTMPLTRKYVDDGGNRQAQIITLKQYRNITINSGVTITCLEWDGNKGGIMPFLYRGKLLNLGTLDLRQAGFRGGAGGRDYDYGGNRVGQYGEGPHAKPANVDYSKNTTGGGSGRSNSDNGGGGAGGGNKTAGGVGETADNNPNAIGGQAADAFNNDQQKLVFFNGAGGGGGIDDSTFGGAGADAPGWLFCLGKEFDNSSGYIDLRGVNGQNSPGDSGGGGGGSAGGRGLIKGETINVGNNTTNFAYTGGVGGLAGHAFADGGDGGLGGKGGLHCEYAKTLTEGDSDQLTSRQDLGLLLRYRGAAALAGFLST